MVFTRFFRNILGIDDLEERVTELEDQMEHVFNKFDSDLDTFKDYKNKTEEELRELASTMDYMLDVTEALINTEDNKANLDRAKAVQRKIRHNRTRAMNALAS